MPVGICRCVKITDLCRYSRVLAPKNFLSTPEEVFGEGKLFDKEVEEKTRLAFRVTMKKLDKLNTLSEERREDLAREKIDQVSKYTQIQNTNTQNPIGGGVFPELSARGPAQDPWKD